MDSNSQFGETIGLLFRALQVYTMNMFQVLLREGAVGKLGLCFDYKTPSRESTPRPYRNPI